MCICLRRSNTSLLIGGGDLDASRHGDEYSDIILLAALPRGIIGLLVLALVRCLLTLRVFELLDGCIGKDFGKGLGLLI